MVENKEISALFQLIDDPDVEVFNSVTERIVSIGDAIIPNLENLWETSADEAMQERIELIIYKLHFRGLTEDFIEWKNGSCELLQGALLVCKYCYPENLQTAALQEIEKIRRNIWLELNSYLTPLEQVNVVSGIIYSYYNLKGNEMSYDVKDDFLLTKLLENKRGNALSNGLLYLILCELLDVPAKALQIPKQFILGYFDIHYNYPDPTKQKSEKINFYIDPLNGHVYSQKDVESYFKRIATEPLPHYFNPIDNKKVIQHLLREFSKCFSSANNLYKKNDLLELSNLLED